jgi:argininosuccinate lyase
MPQKKNPDVPELVRGKTGRVYGHLMAMLTNLKGLPLTYNRDLQEDKEPLFDTVDTVVGSLTVYCGMIRSLIIRRERMEECAAKGFSTATDLADYLARKGLPFRTAHEVTGKIVRVCMESDRELTSLSLTEMQTFHPSIEEDIYGVLTPKASVDSRDIPGGTAPARVKKRLAAIRRKVTRSSGSRRDG